MELSFSLQGLPPGVAHSVIKTVKREDAARYALSVIEQRKLKKLYDQLAQPGFNTDLGRQTMVISQGQWYEAMRLYGQTCFQDADFARFLLKHHDEFRVKDVGTRIQSGYTGRGFTQPSQNSNPQKSSGIVAAGKYARLTETA